MKKTFFSSLQIALGLLLTTALGAHAQMKFAINNTSGNGEEVWMYFVAPTFSGSYMSVSSGTWATINATTTGSGNTYGVQLSDVMTDSITQLPTLSITSMAGGSQMWFSYGSTSLDFTNTPSPTNTGAANNSNFNTRFQFIEPTVVTSGTTSGVNVDVTVEDYFSIPINIQAKTSPTTLAAGIPANNQYTSPTQTIVSALSASATSARINIYSGSTPVNGTPTNPSSLPAADFVRAVSPTQEPTLYHSWTNYLTALAPGGVLHSGTQTIQIKDDNYVGSGAGTGPAFDAQTYDLTLTVDANAQTLTITGSTSEIGYVEIVTTFDDLNASTGIYGNNASFTWTTTTAITTFSSTTAATTGTETSGANDVLGTIMGDVVAGLALGFIGSEFGYNNSSDVWWENPEEAFGTGNPDYYDTWTYALFNLTSAYGVAYEDRFGQNLLAFANGDMVGYNYDIGAYLEITLAPDAVPEPSSLMLLLGGGAAFLLRRKSVRRTKTDRPSAE